MSIDRIHVLNKIERIREAEQIKQTELCELLNVSVNTYKGMLKRESPSFEIIERVANKWPQYAYWLMTDKTHPPMHVAPEPEKTEKILFSIIESIDQLQLMRDASYVDVRKINGVTFLVEDTNCNQRMGILLTIWIDELTHHDKERFGTPAIFVEPRFDLYDVDYPGSARDFKRWCDANKINKFSLHYTRKDCLQEIERSRIVVEPYILPDSIDGFGAEKVFANFRLWQAGKI